MAERGLLVGIDVEFDRIANTVATGSRLDELRQNIRRWTLLWDHISIARNGNIANRGNQDIDYLAQVGFAKDIAVEHDGGRMAETTHDVNLRALYWFEEQQPGSWAVDLSPGSLFCPNHGFLPDGHLAPSRGVLVQLANAIPVPDKDVPLAEVLEFKQKRRDELLVMRHEIEELYQRIGKAEDPALALNTGLEELSRTVNDAIKVTREQRLPFRMSTELASVNIAGAIAAAAPQIFAAAPLVTVLSNAAAGAVSLGVGFEWVRRKQKGSPFQYVALYHQELFGE